MGLPASKTTGKDAGWDEARALLRDRLGGEVFQNWLEPLSFEGVASGCAVLVAPSSFVRDWVLTHFRDTVLAVLQGCMEDVVDLKLHLASRAVDTADQKREDQSSNHLCVVTPKSTAETQTFVGTHGVSEGRAAGRQAVHLGSTLDPRLTFENFVVGKPNEFAYAAAQRVAEAADAPFNPLFLYGSVGLGKTHLMSAIANHIKKTRPQCQVVYLSAERFMYHFIKALRFKDTVSFKEQLRAVDVLLVDDIQFIADKASTQEEFFHTFNALVDRKRKVVLSADKSPSDLKGIEERVRSRLAWGLVADIHPTTYELRLGILESKAEGAGVPPEVLTFLAQKITSNVRELEGALTRIMAHAQLVGRQMTIELAKDVLKDLLRACGRVVTLEDIQQYVANYYNVRLSKLASQERTKDVARARQVFMFLAKELTAHSLPEIARACGKRDHTTVLHGVRKIEGLLESDTRLREDVDLLRRMLQS